jgi:predicted cupin superfamily sugar epimerase
MPVDPISGQGAAEIIRLLGLHPHPEGGYFRETFRDPTRDARGRAVSTLIYFLLDSGQVSRWHKDRGLAFLRRGALGNKDFAKRQRDKRTSSRS